VEWKDSTLRHGKKFGKYSLGVEKNSELSNITSIANYCCNQKNSKLKGQAHTENLSKLDNSVFKSQKRLQFH